MAGKYELESQYVIWDNRHGSKVVVKEDADGLGLTEIFSVGPEGNRNKDLLLNLEQLRVLKVAVEKRIADLEYKALEEEKGTRVE